MVDLRKLELDKEHEDKAVEDLNLSLHDVNLGDTGKDEPDLTL